MRIGDDRDGRAALRHDVLTEARRVMRPPREVLICVAANGVLVSVLWFFSPVRLFDAIFTLHQAFMFPVVMASWMIADVPATNELAPDATRVLALLEDDDVVGLERLLRAKHLVLWVIVTPIVLVVAAIMGATSHHWLTMWLTMVWVATVPFAALGISCLIGVRWPYHPIPLAERWEQRSNWRHMLLRWGTLCILPYGVVPLFGLVALLPLVATLAILKIRLSDSSATLVALIIGCAVALPLAFVVWDRGTRIAAEFAVKRKKALGAYLAEPSLG